MPEGKFIKRLHEITAGTLPSIGFKASQTPLPSALLLAVVLPSVDAEHAVAAFEGGAEALMVRVNMQDITGRDETRLSEVLAAANGRPCGIVPVGAPVQANERIQQLRQLGFDFVVVSAHDSPDVMQLEDIGRVMAVDHTFDNDLLKTINELTVDAVEVSLARPQDFGRRLTIRDVMHYKLLRMLLRKPVIVRSERSIQPQDVAALYDVGVEGLVIDATETGSEPHLIKEATRAYHEAIAQLGPSNRKKRGGTPVTIPTLRSESVAASFEPEEPEEPDEE